MKLFVGLGNPGPDYARNRHNIGFAVLDVIHTDFHGLPWKSRHHALVSEVNLASERTYLCKPMTFMNNSGRAVKDLMSFSPAKLSDLVVFHDEIDLEPRKLRVKVGGGVAGHNGLRSIAAHMKSRDFKRVRIGIGHPGTKELVSRHVLGDFSRHDITWLAPMLDAISAASPFLAQDNDSDFMNKVALLMSNHKQAALPEN